MSGGSQQFCGPARGTVGHAVDVRRALIDVAREGRVAVGPPVRCENGKGAARQAGQRGHEHLESGRRRGSASRSGGGGREEGVRQVALRVSLLKRHDLDPRRAGICRRVRPREHGGAEPRPRADLRDDLRNDLAHIHPLRVEGHAGRVIEHEVEVRRVQAEGNLGPCAHGRIGRLGIRLVCGVRPDRAPPEWAYLQSRARSACNEGRATECQR